MKMDNYLFEFRFTGFAKRYLKDLIYDVSKKFNVKQATKNRVVPHITLFGGFTTKDEKKVVETFTKICKKHELITFKLHGFSHIENRVIQVDVLPSKELIEFRKELAKELLKHKTFLFFRTIKTKDYDHKEEFIFHATIAFRDIRSKFSKIWFYLIKQRQPRIEQMLLRATLMKNRKILYEYDFIQKKLLTRNEALNLRIWKKTIELIKLSK